MGIIKQLQLGHPWQTLDPFLFCVHHLDHYPQGNANMGIDRQRLVGRQLGSDFSGRDGWSMYHGQEVPGFPAHPHRGFETITIARQGFIDHADSMGAHARFGQGDVQWMTAGRGIQHSEMFPLVNQDKDNPTELFQIWLNLPASQKMVEPYFTMLWHESIPVLEHEDDQGHKTQLTIVAGQLGDLNPLSPPPDSWAANPKSHVGIYTIVMQPGAQYTLPVTDPSSHRMVYWFEGDAIEVDHTSFTGRAGLLVDANESLPLHNTGTQEAQLLVLEGRPLNEPVAQHGPFVMSNQGQLRQAFADYQRTQFGGWSYDSAMPVWPRTQQRFARHADGREETPTK